MADGLLAGWSGVEGIGCLVPCQGTGLTVLHRAVEAYECTGVVTSLMRVFNEVACGLQMVAAYSL